MSARKVRSSVLSGRGDLHDVTCDFHDVTCDLYDDV